MKNTYTDGIIISNEEIENNIYKIVLDGDFSGEVGQFFMLRGWEGLDPLLPRPISIADMNDDGQLTLLYEVRGRGTHIISKLRQGDKLSLLGPLGSGFNITGQEKNVALVSGGVGIAPLLYLSRKLNCKVDLYCGFRDVSYFTNEFSKYVENIYITTETGTEGHKGFVTDILDTKKYDSIYSCGPIPMMNSLYNITDDINKLQLSMESRMACGIGACLGCTIKTTKGMKRVCKEGPVFSGSEVCFND